MSDRGRVPFALVGVLLLVSSGAIAVSEPAPRPDDPAVDEAMDGLAAETRTALRVAVRAAAREAARRPVVTPANSTVGRHLDDRRPFRDALRLRIYLRARAALARLTGRRRGLHVSATLPPIERAADVRRAIDRVRLDRTGSGNAWLRVEIAGLRLRARRGGRTVGHAVRSPRLVVRTPVLAVHRRVETFEDRLAAEPTEPGLARRLTATLYPVAWARGYAQFHGGPIENVLANRHVALATNGAVLALQRRLFGRPDRLGRRVYARSLAGTAVTGPSRASAVSPRDHLERLRQRPGRPPARRDPIARLRPDPDMPSPDDSLTVDLERLADRAYRRSVASIDETLDRTYAPRIRVSGAVRRRSASTRGAARPAAAESRLGARTRTRVVVEPRPGSPPDPRPGWHPLFGAGRRVTVIDRTITTWSLPGNETATTRRTARRTYAVDLLVAGNHSVGPAPRAPIELVHEPGGPFDGPNLADVRRLAREHVAERGGMDALAVSAVRGELDATGTRVQAARPAALAERAAADLDRLRRRLHSISVTVERSRVATWRTNVPARLAARVRERRASLVDPPDSYEHVAQRARVGVRAAYVDQVLARLTAAADQHDRGRVGIAGALSNGSSAALAADPAAAWTGSSPAPRPVRMAVDATPSYLTLAPLERAGRTEYPLVARNLNAVALPTDGVIEAVFGVLDGPERTSVRTSAQVLAATGRTRPGDVDTRRLRAAVGRAVSAAVRAQRRTLARHGRGQPATRAALVRQALRRWNGTAARALAFANGSAADAVAEAAVKRWPGADRERLAIALRTAADRALSTHQPPRAMVNGTATELADWLRRASSHAGDRTEALAKREAARLAARLPRGVPVVPAPGLWYAMVNAWRVGVRGSYARFVVRVPRGAPDRLPADFRYVREHRSIRLDVDGDGRAERLGRNRRISFRTGTVVAVAVPPKPTGVGDVGARDERSAGWPDPGPVEAGN